MSLLIGTRRTLLGGAVAAAEYADKLLATQSANLVAYWPLWEPSGGVADNLEGTMARDAAYTGVTLGQTGIGDGHICPLFDGVNDYIDVYSDSLRDIFSGAEGTFLVWTKVFNAGVWTNGLEHTVVRIGKDTSNYIWVYLVSTSNRVWFEYKAGGTVEQKQITGISDTGWILVGITWSVIADTVTYIWDGSSVGIDTSLGTWAATPLVANQCYLGVKPNLTSDFYGYQAHAALWTISLTASEIAALAVV